MNTLKQILAAKRAEVTRRKAAHPLPALAAEARQQEPPRGFRAALAKAAEPGGYGLIAEIKRASPSRGRIREDFDPAMLARAYHRGGACCLSVLTDAQFFEGDGSHLAAARAAVPLPVLRKDFLIDPYQLAESRRMGADCVLVILAALDDAAARSLMEGAAAWGMDVLVEVHNAAELTRAIALGSVMVGINNRDLATFHTDLAVTERLAPLLPGGVLAVAESGISGSTDLDRLAQSGVRCFLVGESLMRETDVAAATRALLARQAA